MSVGSTGKLASLCDRRAIQHRVVRNHKARIVMEHCEECGKTDVPLMVVIFSLKNKENPNTLHTESLYLCKECLNKSEQHNEKSPTIH